MGRGGGRQLLACRSCLLGNKVSCFIGNKIGMAPFSFLRRIAGAESSPLLPRIARLPVALLVLHQVPRQFLPTAFLLSAMPAAAGR